MFIDKINLLSDRLGAKVLWASDDFFAEKENLIKSQDAIFIADKYTDRGKWMDGWESRRKRDAGHDSCILKLGCQGVICGFDINTSHFLGNHPPQASIDACLHPSDEIAEMQWQEILPKQDLKPGSENLFSVDELKSFSHLRLHIYPDGGVARLRAFGDVSVDWSKISDQDVIDLASVEFAAKVLACNDMFFSSKDNLIMPGRGVNMGDGWETKRRRTAGHDWLVLALGHPGKIQKIEIDTAHFKGNFPDHFSLEACYLENEAQWENANWHTIQPESKLEADKQHYFEIIDCPKVSHLRLNIFPDGGVSRLRAWGTIA